MKRIIQGCLSGAMAFMSLNSFAAVTLQIPQDLDIKVVNLGKPEINGGLLSDHKTITLPDGVNQIVFQYTPHFITRKEAKIAYSDVYIAKFSAKNATVSFHLPDYGSYDRASQEIEHMTWSLTDNTGHTVATQSEKLNLSGVTLGHDFIEDATAYNKHGGIAAVGMTYVTVDNSTGASHSGQAQVKPVITNNLSQLQKLYLQTSKAERKAFRKWLVDQD